MQPHIAQTIADIRDAIARQQDLLAWLENFGHQTESGLNGQRSEVGIQRSEVRIQRAAPVSVTPGFSRVKSARRSTKTVSTVSRKSPLRRSDAAARAITAGNLLVCPFERPELARALGLTLNGAGSQITRWVAAGFVRRVGYGKFERTAKFPKSASASPAPSTPVKRGPLTDAVLKEADRADVETKLEAALKQRDHARAEGRDEMASYFQGQVNKFEAQLGKS